MDKLEYSDSTLFMLVKGDYENRMCELMCKYSP